MTQLLTPPAGDPRTPEEYTYDMQHSGAIYTTQPAAAPDALTKIFEFIENDDDYEPFGALRGGDPIVGVRDYRDSTERAGIVHAQLGELWLTAQDEPNLFSVQGFGGGIGLEDMTIEQINALRAFLATDIPEQLLASAVAYGRGDTQPPSWTTSPSPAITVETWQSDEKVTYTDFDAGAGLSSVTLGCYSGEKPGVELIIGGNCINERLSEVITLADVQTLRDNLTALLQDPRVKAARAEC